MLHGLYAARIAIVFNWSIWVVHFSHLSWFHKHMTACMYGKLLLPTGLCQKIREFIYKSKVHVSYLNGHLVHVGPMLRLRYRECMTDRN